MQKKLWVLGLMVVVVIGAMFGGCGKKEAGVSNKKAKVTYMYAGGTANDEIVKKATKLFEKKHPEIEVELIYVPNWGTYVDKITTSLASNTAPDCISLGVYQIGDFIRKGALMDFAAYIDKDKEFQKMQKDIFPASLMDLMEVDGGVYGIPAWQNPDVLYYNKNLFDEAGVSYPDESWDYDRFVEESLKLTKTANGKTTQFGTWGLNWYWNYLWAYGADVLNDDGTKSLLDTPEAIEAFEYMISLSRKHHVAPRPAERSQQTDYQAFMTGKVATFTSGRYMIPMLKDIKDFQWDVAMLPHGKNRETVNNVVYWLGLKSSKNPDATWEYIKFLTSKEVQEIIVSYDNDVPILRSVVESELFINPNKPPKSDQVFIDALANSRPFPLTMDVWIDGAVNEALENVVLNNMTVKEAFTSAARKINQHLQER